MKSFGRCQPARTAQADVGRNVSQMNLPSFSLLSNLTFDSALVVS